MRWTMARNHVKTMHCFRPQTTGPPAYQYKTLFNGRRPLLRLDTVRTSHLGASVRVSEDHCILRLRRNGASLTCLTEQEIYIVPPETARGGEGGREPFHPIGCRLRLSCGGHHGRLGQWTHQQMVTLTLSWRTQQLIYFTDQMSNRTRCFFEDIQFPKIVPISPYVLPSTDQDPSRALWTMIRIDCG